MHGSSDFGWGVMNFTISCLLTLQMLHTKFGKDWSSSFSEEDVKGRRTTHDDGSQPIAILSDSGLSETRDPIH